MESVVVKFFEAIFNSVRILLFCGLMAGVLSGLQKAAFHSKQFGLVSMLQVNQQLIGRTK
jgi:predicted lipid-binding transport protein (Tim44 family)